MPARFETPRTFSSYYPGWGWGWVVIIRLKAISVQSIEIELTETELGINFLIYYCKVFLLMNDIDNPEVAEMVLFLDP